MQLEALRQLPYESLSSGFLQVVDETAPRQGQGKQAGRFSSMGGSSGKRMRAYLGMWEREGQMTHQPSALKTNTPREARGQPSSPT